MTRTKSKPKHVSASAPKVQALEEPPTELSSDAAQKFELELCWCIQQLQSALGTGKLTAKEIKDHTKALNILMSKTTSVVQKRQVMRTSFGDYRLKMVDQEKKFKKVSEQIKILPAAPNTKSQFVKKSTPSSSFQFNFDVKKENEETTQQNEGKESRRQNENQFNFLPSSDNVFRFNFDIAS